MSVENKIIRVLIALIIIFIVSVAIYETVTGYVIPENKYKNANSLLEQEKLEEALTAFEEIEEYKDSKSKITQCNNKIREKKIAELSKYVGAYRHVEYITNEVFNEDDPYGDVFEITSVTPSDIKITFESLFGGSIAEFTSTAKLDGDKYNFTFTDTWYNKGKGTLTFEGDVIKLKIEITQYDDSARFAVNEGDMEFNLSEKTQLDM